MHERDTLKKNLPAGRWPSVITTGVVTEGSPRLAEPCIVNEQLYWVQSMPHEKGRNTLMRLALCDASMEKSSREPDSILPRPLSAKSKVHEYGGGSYCVANDFVYFVLADDQQIYRAALGENTRFQPECLTRQGPATARYANLVYDHTHASLIAVCEDHNEHFAEPITNLVSIAPNGELNTIASGDDFYSSPALSPCGNRLVWLCWNHPDMPWDSTELWLSERDGSGLFKKENAHKLLGNPHQSIFQPQFRSNGDLFFVSDQNNWWNIYKINSEQLQFNSPEYTNIFEAESEFATPHWVFKMSTYGFLNDTTLFACCSQDGYWKMLQLDLTTLPATAKPVLDEERTLNHFSDIFCDGKGNGVCVAASPASAPKIYHCTAHGSLCPVIEVSNAVPEGDISIPESITFPTSHGEHAFGFYYAPQNSRCSCADNPPPLIVICHGGPTGATDTAFNPKIQYWTNRGFAVIDVNYRGSTGFGRRYRRALNGNWGVFDVADVCAAAQYAVSQGWADPNKLIIKGSSAGGYSVLAALAFTNTFKAGVSLYGIGDLETLVRDTHKFEARYLETLIGRYPEQQDLYRERSPIHHVNSIDCPLLVFQGLQDRVVPPNQAQAMVEAVRAKGLHVEYVTFDDEGHGFRNAANVTSMLERELAFYQKVFQL